MIKEYKTPVVELFLMEETDIICNSLDPNETPIIPAIPGTDPDESPIVPET